MIDQSQPAQEIVRAVHAALLARAGPDGVVRCDARTLAIGAPGDENGDRPGRRGGGKQCRPGQAKLEQLR